MSSERTPGRDFQSYLNLSRSVATSHARTEKAKKVHHSTNVLSNFLNKKWVLWIWHYIKSRFGPRHKFPTYEGQEKGIYLMPLKSKIALVADWATDTNESKSIGNEITKHEPDYSIHLGDTYFVGAPFEIENNFLPGKSFWHYGLNGSFALTGNHEMYSNGDGYFNKLLPWMGSPRHSGQKASYFCLENEYWRIIGLDTGFRSVGFPILELLFAKADLRPEVTKWLKNDLKIQEDKRGLIFLSHHQYGSAFDKRYPSAAKQLFEIIGSDRNVLWFWGHEHRFAIYGKYSIPNGITAYGRCIGHGGMPTSILSDDQQEKKRDRIVESNLVLFDNRIRTNLQNEEVGYNGYAMLTIENENLTVKYYDEKKLLITENWSFNPAEGKINGVDITNHCTAAGFELIKNKDEAIQ